MLVETERLVNVSTIAAMLEVRPSAVSNWRHRDVGFPLPYVTICKTDYWLDDAVWAWYYDRIIDSEIALKNRINRLREQLERLERQRG